MGEISHQIAEVAENSIGAQAGLCAGDIILEMNGAKIRDIFDYHYYSDDEVVDIKVQGPDGSIRVCHVEKEIGQDLGITFENGLMDDYRSCHNQCIFCFIDQMPPGMRDTLYFKDDDTRLSFLQGNYVTLTNISEEDMSRIISYHLAPIKIPNCGVRCFTTGLPGTFWTRSACFPTRGLK